MQTYKWRPIKYAPKNGVPLVLHTGNGVQVGMFSIVGGGYFVSHEPPYTVLKEPTHWMCCDEFDTNVNSPCGSMYTNWDEQEVNRFVCKLKQMFAIE